MSAPEYSVVVPVYNSENSLKPLMTRIAGFFTGAGKSYQVLMVDDGSKDQSWRVMEELKAQYGNNLRLVRLAKNSGQHNATLCGIHQSSGQFIITIDDDLQIPPEEIGKLIHKYDETHADLVYGSYAKKKHSLFRNLGSLAFNTIFRYIGNTTGGGSSFRLMTRSLAYNLKSLNHRYLLLDEVLCWYTNSIAFVITEHHPRALGRSGYSAIKLFLLSINYIISYTILPLRIMTFMGMFFSIITFCIGMYYIYNKLFHAVSLGFTSLIVAVFFSTSLVLFCLGIIGEYMSRLYSGNKSPHYIIKEIR